MGTPSRQFPWLRKMLIYKVLIVALPGFVCGQTDRTDTQLTFAWTVQDGGLPGPTDCASVTVCIVPAPSPGASCKTVTGTSDRVTFSNLSPGTQYTATLTTRDTDDPNTDNPKTQTATGQTLPGRPTGVTAVRNTENPQTVVDVSWTPPAGEVDSYTVTCDGPGDDDFTQYITDPLVTEASCTERTAGTLYNVTVRTNRGSDTNTSDPAVRVYTGLNPPTDVRVNEAETTTNNLTVIWTSVVGSYDHVRVNCTSTDPGAIDVSVEVDKEAPQPDTATCTGLTPGASYTITATSVINTAPPDPPPEAAGATISATTVPSVPSSVNVTSINTTAVSIQIIKGEGVCSRFFINYTEKGENSPQRAVSPCPASAPVELGSLATNQEYTIDVITESTGAPENSTHTTGSGWTLSDAPPEHDILSSGPRRIEANVNNVTTRPENILHYQLWVTGPGGTCTEISGTKTGTSPGQVDCDMCTPGTVQDSPYNMTGLTPYKDYFITVVAVNPGGCSTHSENITTTTAQDNDITV